MFSLRGIPMRLVYSALLLAALAGCAAQPRSLSAGMTGDEVSAALGKPAATGRLASGEEYWDFSKQPFGYSIDRVTFAADGRVREVRNLLTENNFKNLQAGMTPGQVVAIVGPSPASEQRAYAGGTKSWRYRYRDLEVIKLLHVIFGPDDRLQTHYTEWDPRVYSKGGSGRDSGGK
jgi:outer membrane protein assembly factor BamE (lipoprotein component of BamABCDE complex)